MPALPVMTPVVKIVAAAASLAAASATYVAMNRTASPEGTAGGSVVCVGSDMVLRRMAGKACPPGHQRLELSEAEGEMPSWEGWDDGDKDLVDRAETAPGSINDLEKRLRKLEQKPWFEVVDSSGKRIFTVGPGAATLYNGSGAEVGAMYATAGGGFFIARSASGTLEAGLGASGSVAGARVLESDFVRAEIGRQPEGHYAMRFPSPSRGVLAGIGESKAGTGAMVVANLAGAPKASLTIQDGKGVASIFNDAGAALLSLTEGATQGGLLAIGNASSDPMVKMGVQDNRYGVVLTGPKAGLPYIPNSGLPGSYILGCAAQCGPGGK